MLPALYREYEIYKPHVQGETLLKFSSLMMEHLGIPRHTNQEKNL
jgi:hypothetical protein